MNKQITPPVKFTSIAAAGGLNGQIFALDSDGRLWLLQNGKWMLIARPHKPLGEDLEIRIARGEIVVDPSTGVIVGGNP